MPGAALADLVEQAEGAAVQVVAGNDVRAGVQQLQRCFGMTRNEGAQWSEMAG